MRLIDAGALIAQMEADAEHMEDALAVMMTYAAINDVKCFPTVDAVPVVRCRDCKYWDTIPGSTFAPMHHQCKETRLMTTGTWYCPLGKRKDGDNHDR